MALVLNEEQQFLKDTALDFFASRAPVSALRALRDTRDPLGYDADLWREMGELGWAGIALPEAFGGAGFGFTGLGAVAEASGRSLAASPLFASAVVGASAILLGGSDAQRQALLPAIAAGNHTLALALEENHHHRPHTIATRVAADGGGYVIDGAKCFVQDGHSADTLLVAARSHGDEDDRDGISLLLVPRAAPGVAVQRTCLADSRNHANITLAGVRVGADALLGEPGNAGPLLEQVLDRGRAVLAAEMLGLAEACFARTVDYLRERRQFGVKIGSFQALQHRAARLQVDLELARSVVQAALSAVDDSPAQLPLLASLAKARLNELVRQVTNEAVQMHGGIGVTDELDIGLYLKRARVAIQIFGDTGFHRDRYAALCGF